MKPDADADEDRRPPAMPKHVSHKLCVRCGKWLALYHVMHADTLVLDAVCAECLTLGERERGTCQRETDGAGERC